MRVGFLTASMAAALAGCGDAPDPAAAQRDAARNALATQANAAAVAPATAATGRQYAALAGAGDLFEIEAARLAQQKAQRPDVREFAAALLADHQRSTAELTRAVAQARPPIRFAPSLSGEQQANLELLRRIGGAVFDAVWLRQQVTAHERALTLVTAYATSGESEPLRRHAAALAEPIRRHLARARELEVPAPR